MEFLHLKKIVIFFLLSVPLTLIFAQEKLLIVGIPLYVPEILTIGAFGSLIFLERRLPDIPLKRNIFFWAFALMIFGFFLSIVFNDVTPHGYGRLKSWFLFPALYGVMLVFSLRRGLLSLGCVLRTVFLSGVVIGIATLFSAIFFGGFSYDHRLHGFFPSPNHLAMLLGTAILVGISHGVSLRINTRNERFFVFSGVTFLSMLLLLTQSYGVIFSLIGVLGLALVKYHNQFSQTQKRVVFFGFALCIGVLLSLSDAKWQSLITFDERSSIVSRGMIWHSAVRMIGEHPLAGIGLGNFQEQYLAYQQYFPPYLEWSVPHPHNIFLDIWLEGGIFSLIGFCIGLGTLLFSGASYFWQKKNGSIQRVFSFLLVVYFLLIGMTDVPFLRNDLAYFFAIAFAMIVFVSREEADTSSRHDD